MSLMDVSNRFAFLLFACFLLLSLDGIVNFPLLGFPLCSSQSPVLFLIFFGFPIVFFLPFLLLFFAWFLLLRRKLRAECMNNKRSTFLISLSFSFPLLFHLSLLSSLYSLCFCYPAPSFVFFLFCDFYFPFHYCSAFSAATLVPFCNRELNPLPAG